MTLNYSTLAIKPPQNGVIVIAFNRPDAANALNKQMAQEIKQFFVSLPQDKSIRAVILTGQGDKAFCAGADLKERKDMDETLWHAQHHAFEEALHSIMESPLPVIAAVNGAAYGGGAELALACDFIYAAHTARFALPETTLGIIPGLGGGQQLARAIGTRRAKEMIFSGKPFSAQEAHAWGMVNRLCEPGQLLSEAFATAQTIAANAPLAMQAIKKAIDAGAGLPLKEALACELTYYNALLNTRDRHEGIDAWGEKRKPVFTGE